MVIGNYFIALFGLLFACAANAEAVTPDQPQVTFGGFGSLGVSHSTMSSGDYVLDGGIPCRQQTTAGSQVIWQPRCHRKFRS
jgi:hypothetical protein